MMPPLYYQLRYAAFITPAAAIDITPFSLPLIIAAIVFSYARCFHYASCLAIDVSYDTPAATPLTGYAVIVFID
jgi:hypothetical protein